MGRNKSDRTVWARALLIPGYGVSVLVSQRVVQKSVNDRHSMFEIE